jgi:hypothetical protein
MCETAIIYMTVIRDIASLWESLGLVLKFLQLKASLFLPCDEVYEVKAAWLGLIGRCWQCLRSIEYNANKSSLRLCWVLVKVNKTGLKSENSMIFSHADLK